MATTPWAGPLAMRNGVHTGWLGSGPSIPFRILCGLSRKAVYSEEYTVGATSIPSACARLLP